MLPGFSFDPAYARSHFLPITTNTFDIGKTGGTFRTAYLQTSIVFAATTFAILGNTADGSDNQTMQLCAGGAFASDGSRGANCQIIGNEASSNPGFLVLSAGNISGAKTQIISPSGSPIELICSSTAVFQVAASDQIKWTSSGANCEFFSPSNSKKLRIWGGSAASTGTSSMIGIEGTGYLSAGDIELHLTSAAASTTGQIKFVLEKSDQLVTIYNSTTARVSWDVNGVFQNRNSSNESTGAGTALLGTNSPAVTNAAPYTWIKEKTSDGSTVYRPVWK